MSHNLDLTILFGQICRKFNLSIVQVNSEFQEESKSNKPTQMAKLTNLETQEVIELTLSLKEGIQSQICKAVAAKYPKSPMAESYRRASFSHLVTLKPDWDLELGYQLHVALRKCCDSSASQLWHHLLSKASGTPLFSVFVKHMSNAAREVFGISQENKPQSIRIGKLIVRTRQALKEAFDCALDLRTFEDSYSRVNFSELEKKHGITRECLENMSIKALKEMTETAQLAYKAVDFLSNDDLEGLWSYVVEYVREEESEDESDLLDSTAAANPN